MKQTVIGVIAALSMTAMVHAVLIDFNDIPDGTSVFLGNPYAGILNIQAKAGSEFYDPETDEQVIAYIPARFVNGYLEILPFFHREAINFYAQARLTFLQPVKNLSFDAFTYRIGSYTYNDGILGGFTQNEVTGPFQFATFSLPRDVEITSLFIGNADRLNEDGAIWLDNIRFDLASQNVHDAGSSLLLLGLSLVGIYCTKIRGGRGQVASPFSQRAQG